MLTWLLRWFDGGFERRVSLLVDPWWALYATRHPEESLELYQILGFEGVQELMRKMRASETARYSGNSPW